MNTNEKIREGHQYHFRFTKEKIEAFNQLSERELNKVIRELKNLLINVTYEIECPMLAFDILSNIQKKDYAEDKLILLEEILENRLKKKNVS